MIVYHPAYDLNHCAFRFLTLLYDIPAEEISWDTMKMIDFYFLFPHLIKKINLPRSMHISRKELNKISEPYEASLNPRRIMYELTSIHDVVVRELIAKRIISKESFLKGSIKLINDMIPEKIIQEIDNVSQRQTYWYDFLVRQFSQYQVNGEKGLKKRTKMMEYKYDE